MTRAELRQRDTEVYEEEIVKINKGRDGYTLSLDNGSCFFCGFPEDGPEPEVGDIARFYGRRYGGVRGLVLIRGEVEYPVFYRTQQEEERKNEERLEKNRQRMLAEYNELIEQIKDEPERRTADISGFGGRYEYTCQIMLQAGIKWLSSHSHIELSFEELKGVFGVINPDNLQAKALYDYVLDAIDGDCSGGMMHAVMDHLVSISQKGVDKWLDSMDEDRIYTFPNIPEPKV